MNLLSSIIPFLSFSFPIQAANIVLTNDDGWADTNIRAFYTSLTNANHSVVLSAPAVNESGRGSLEGPARPVTQGCEFQSCPPHSPSHGHNISNPRLNYYNSYPVSAMKYGVQTLSPHFFPNSSLPDLVVAGPNVGSNLGLITLLSGTVGAVSAAADQLHIPAIAFSGRAGVQTAWNEPTPAYALLYAVLATTLTTTLLERGAPYLPPSTFLNINFPAAGPGTGCERAEDFRLVLTRVFAAGVWSGRDVKVCGNGGRLVTETEVAGLAEREGRCWGSVSVGRAGDKRDAGAGEQKVVVEKLGAMLSCLPGSGRGRGRGGMIVQSE